MAHNKKVWALNPDNHHDSIILRLLQDDLTEDLLEEAELPPDFTRFYTGSWVYQKKPIDWEKEHDIDVVFPHELIVGTDLEYHLMEQYCSGNDEGYNGDFSLYFQTPEGQVYNFITLQATKYKAWSEASGLVTAICSLGTDLSKYMLETRSARVDLFVMMELKYGIGQPNESQEEKPPIVNDDDSFEEAHLNAMGG